MSALADALVAKAMKVYRPDRPATKASTMFDASVAIKPQIHLLQEQYDFTVTYRSRHYLKDRDDLKHMLDIERRVLDDAIYGEFRTKLLELEMAVYEGEDVKARKLVDEIIRMTHA